MPGRLRGSSSRVPGIAYRTTAFGDVTDSHLDLPPAHQHAEQAGARADVVGGAAGPAEVGVAEPLPPVGRRVGEHPLELARRPRPGARPARRRRRRSVASRPASASRTRSSSPSDSRRGPASDGTGGPRVAAAGRRRSTTRRELALEPRDLRAQRAPRAAPLGGRAAPATRICSIAAIAPRRGSVPPDSRPYPRCPMPRNDPTDTGGLFIGRRPGTGPLHYRGDARARRARAAGGPTRCSPSRVLALEVLVCLTLWGPQPRGVAVGRLAGRLPRGLGHARDRGRVRRA